MAHEFFSKYGTPAIKLIEECSELQKELCKAERFGLDDYNPLKKTKTTVREKINEEIADVEKAIANYKEYMRSIPKGTQRFTEGY
jgi:cyclopropane fatty-acyl-phospholipid synthase-like methyltransferase